jgi:hypothetical protein
LVVDYTTTIDEISVIVAVFTNTLEMLNGLKKDITNFERIEAGDGMSDYADSQNRVDFSIRTVSRQLGRLESMLHDMRKEMDAVSPLPSLS